MGYPKVFVERGVQTASPPSATASPSATDDDDAYNQSRSSRPVSLMHAPLISRRAPRHTLHRPEVKDVERRVVSMPQDKPVQHFITGSRVVSMPEYTTATVDLSLDTPDSESYSVGASFDYGIEKRRVRVRPASSDVPRTPSPPSSPDSVLIINSHAQLSDGFLRKNYLPKKTTASSNGLCQLTIAMSRLILSFYIQI